MMSCRNCKYFLEMGLGDDKHYGECRRYPPRAASGKDYDVYPWLHRTSWCGEFVIAEDRVSVGADVKDE